uniref:UNC93-like protein MFSD11 n=1 Tax=Sinocyclocheilus rhinocerous TaxID=307959 RepID=A0A673MNK0_9TELE
MADVRTYNVVILGIGFLLIFTAFTTCGNIEQTVVKSLNSTNFTGSGYHSLGIIYGVFSFCNVLAPTIVAIIGPQFTMFLSGVLYSGYIAVFIIPSTWSFYLTSVIIGIGAALLWTAQGHFLVENSDASTINRNTGLFWALLQCRFFFLSHFFSSTDRDRTIMFIALLVISALGTLSFLALRKVCQQEECFIISYFLFLFYSYTFFFNFFPPLETILEIFKTKTILLLSFCMAYSGLELSFYSGVYGTCIGATTHFGDAAKGLIGISGIVVGVGEIVGGGLFGLVLKNNRFRRTSVVFLGMVVHFVAFYLIFLNIPDDKLLIRKVRV